MTAIKKQPVTRLDMHFCLLWTLQLAHLVNSHATVFAFLLRPAILSTVSSVEEMEVVFWFGFVQICSCIVVSFNPITVHNVLSNFDRLCLEIFLHSFSHTHFFADSFVNSQEWTLSRAVPDLRLVSALCWLPDWPLLPRLLSLIGRCWLCSLRKVCACSSILDRFLSARRIARRWAI